VTALLQAMDRTKTPVLTQVCSSHFDPDDRGSMQRGNTVNVHTQCKDPRKTRINNKLSVILPVSFVQQIAWNGFLFNVKEKKTLFKQIYIQKSSWIDFVQK
jgi:hypothetical protein